MTTFENKFDLDDKEELKEIRESLCRFFLKTKRHLFFKQVREMSDEEFITFINKVNWAGNDDTDEYYPTEVEVKGKGKFISWGIDYCSKKVKNQDDKVFLTFFEGELTPYKVEISGDENKLKGFTEMFERTDVAICCEFAKPDSCTLNTFFIYKKDAEEFYDKVVELYFKE